MTKEKINLTTITEIAKDIGVSRQAIHQRIRRNPLMDKLEPHISIMGNTVYIDVDGIRLIKSAFRQNQSSIIDTRNVLVKSTQCVSNVQTQLDSSCEQIQILTNQNTFLSKQNSELQTQLNQLRIDVVRMSDRMDNLVRSLQDAIARQHTAFGEAVKQLVVARDECQRQLAIRDRQIEELIETLRYQDDKEPQNVKRRWWFPLNNQ